MSTLMSRPRYWGRRHLLLTVAATGHLLLSERKGQPARRRQRNGCRMTTPAPSGTFQHGEIGMRMTREQAIRYHGVLTQIAQGQKGGVAPDIAPRAYVLMVT